MYAVIRVGAVTSFLFALLACSPDGPGIDDGQRGDGDQGRRGPQNDLGFTPIPAAPEVRRPLVELGEALAYDRILSGNRDVSCMTCHHPLFATGDARALPAGVGADGLGPRRSDEAVVPRNAPPLFNLHAMPNMFWDGRVEMQNGELITPAGAQLTDDMIAVFEFGVVSAQAMFPVTSREEMRGQEGDNELANLGNNNLTAMWNGLMRRLGAIDEYVDLFEAAYPGTAFEDMSFAHAANAIAGFEIATFESRGSLFERFLRGEDVAIPEAAIEGAREFRDSNCTDCHDGAGLSDFEHHNTALAQIGPGKGVGVAGREDRGRQTITRDGRDAYAFRTPPLTNVTLTGPWGHAGQINELRDFVDHYDEPLDALRAYNVRQSVDNPGLFDDHFTASDNAIAATVDNDAEARGRLDVGEILAFLESLEDPGVLSLVEDVPLRVPSGLPVDGR